MTGGSGTSRLPWWAGLGVIFCLIPGDALAQCPVASGDTSIVGRNKAVYCRFVDEVYNGGTMAMVDSLVAKDFVMNGTSMTREEIKQSIGALRTGFPDLHVDVESLVGEGDEIAARVVIRGTHKGTYLGTPRTGKSIVLNSLVLYRVRDGMLAKRWSGPDDLELRRQLGLL